MLSSRPALRRVAGATATALVAGVVPLALAPSASAAPTELFVSEYVEGTSNNKALEVYNGTGAPVDLLAGGYTVQVFANGSATATSTIPLSGTVANGDAFVLANPSANAAILAAADQRSGSANWNGDDAVVLTKGSTVLDVIGQVGFRPTGEWGSGLTSTADNTLRRKATVQAGDADGSDAFDPSAQWDGFAVDTVDGLGSHTIDSGPAPDAAPSVTATTPAAGATNVAAGATLSVTFSEPVSAGAGAFVLTCTSGPRSLTVTGGPTTWTLDPTTDLAAGDACTLTVSAAAVSDTDAIDPPDGPAADTTVAFTVAAADPCTAPITPIPAIQGSGATVATPGPVTTRGVVVGDYEGASPNLRGFYLQDPTGDGDPATSDGIFVFEGSNADTVKVGDLVTVNGTAAENQGQSQVSAANGGITVCASGQSVAPTEVSFPVASDTFLERYEGMLVRLPQSMSVTEHFQLGRFGQVVVSQGGRLEQPTNVVAPGADAAALQAANNLRKVIVDDATQAQNPDPIVFARGDQPLSASNTLRGGDTVTGLTGVLTYTWGGNSASPNAYRVRPLGALGGQAHFEATNPRPTSAPAVGGSTRVVGMNLLNFFNTLDTTGNNCTGGTTGAAMDCRGANTPAEFDRQWHKTVAAVSGTGADVVAFMEMENDGYGADSAEQFLVDRLNDQDGAGTWAFIDADARTGQVDAMGSDAIKVGMLYKPAKVTPVGTTAALNTDAFVTGGDSAPRNRPSLAQAFRDTTTGGVFVAVANHLKSKGSACAAPDTGDGQANCAAVRTRAAQLLSDWLATDPTKTGDDDVLLLGDMNSYAKEDPIAMFESKGYTNLIAARNGREAYSYAFDGQWGYLDHALGSASLAGQVAGVADWHVNADEPSVLDYNTEFKSPGQVQGLYAPDQFRISDHDPVVVGLDLANAAPVVGAVTVTPSGPVRVGTPVQVSAGFTDADPLDTHTATVDWGDGTSGTATVTGGTVTASHAYTSAGVRTVTVTVSDPWGHRDSATSSVVVYDPAAGFLTGGGTVTSPRGAIVGDPSRTGKAAFGVAALYTPWGTRPTGVLTYATPGFTLASASPEWLVVSGDTARLAGTALVNGRQGYRFEASFVDGAPDTLHLVVRDAAGGLVYDSAIQRVQGQVRVH